MKRLPVILSILILLGGVFSTARLARASAGLAGSRLLVSRPDKLDPQLREALSAMRPGEMISAIVTLADQADLGEPSSERFARQGETIVRLRQTAERSQGILQPQLQAMRERGGLHSVTPLWIFNGLSVTADAAALEELASLPEVAWITPDAIDIVPAARQAYAFPEINLAVVNAPSLWNLGFTGQGVVVASMDSGVDASHPDLAPRWRGGDNSWFDPYHQHATPADLSGHGTQVMGVMVGGEAGGTSLGMAPGAQWIAVKIFNDSGSATATAIHLGFQWLLDPDGNPATADAPQVVNNSWAFGGPGCNLEFQLDLQALGAAGILPVFSAGNYGPNGSTSVSPANNPEAFAVGAVNNGGTIYGYSSRGPSACGETANIYPDLVAPGVNIHTTDRYGFYLNVSGTSLAAPHVSGAVALLLSAYPDSTPDQLRAALLNSATDLGAAGPDNNFGYGRLNSLAAYNWLAGGIQATNTPAPTATNTLAPAATNTSLPSATATATPTTAATNPPVSTATNTPQPTITNTPTATATSSPTPAPTNTPTATATSSPSPASTNTPTATATSSPTPVATNTPTPTSAGTLIPTGTAAGLHIADLDAVTARLSLRNWIAAVYLHVHTQAHQPLSGVTISGRWSSGRTGSCITDTLGRCLLSSGSLNTSLGSITFTVTGVTRASFTYQPGINHDPDGDSDGTTILMLLP